MPSTKFDALSDLDIQQAECGAKDRKLVDGRGLYVLVRPNGAKRWRFKYRLAGKERLLAVGEYPGVSLAEARRRRDMARDEVARGIDPVQAQRQRKAAAAAAERPVGSTTAAPSLLPSASPLPSSPGPQGSAAAEPKILRRSLHDEVTARLRDMIVDGRLTPGQTIPELDVARQLGISRTPLREALKVLASEGLVDLSRGRGAVVKALTAKDVQQMLALMAMLEQQAGRQACRASDEEIAAIARMHEQMRGHYLRHERPEYFLLNQKIHNAIVGAAGNETLSLVHGILRARMRRIRYIGNGLQENWSAAMAEHEAIMAALSARDEDRTGALMGEHIANTWPRIVATFKSIDHGV